jgi:hypothetical protein
MPGEIIRQARQYRKITLSIPPAVLGLAGAYSNARRDDGSGEHYPLQGPLWSTVAGNARWEDSGRATLAAPGRPGFDGSGRCRLRVYR